VRNIVGNAIAVAINKKQAGWLKKLLNAKDHSLAMPMAPAHGLYFYQVQYN
jgi:tRNA pseudouridine38-40 synthase